MAIDYYLSSISHEQQIPIIRFYGWEPYCLSIGYHQKTDLVDFSKLKQKGYGFVRRPTGGRAIFHAEELTYSIQIPKDLLHHQQLYLFIHEIFTHTLQDLGFVVDLKCDKETFPKLTHQAEDFPCFTKSAWSEVQYRGKKVIGSAQKIYKKSILQHGSLLIGKLHANLPHYLTIDDENRLALSSEIYDKTICLNEINSFLVTIDLLITSFLNQLELMTNISVNSLALNEHELKLAKIYCDKFC
jgi:lipoate-protein ligase A